MPATRSVLVEARRLDGWVTRFVERNGPTSVHPADPAQPPGDAGVTLSADNGCSAVLVPPLPAGGPDTPPDLAGLRALLLAGVGPETMVGMLLIRRGGYSVGVARNGAVLTSKTGTRYVQGRTAAGGWSQQRFARRRANQADALVEETAARAAALWRAQAPSCVQLGGDRTLAAAALAEPVLAAFAHLPQVPFRTVTDPRFTVLKEVAASALSVRITVTDPPGPDS